MNLRPRCRDWLPLSTQQLRLRNLVRIEGVNIEATSTNSGKETLVYYTLHSCRSSAPFYTSEALPQRHLQQKWADIECNEMLKSNANCVCIKVWKCCNQCDTTNSKVAKTEPNEAETKEPINALTRQVANTCLSPYKLPRPPDAPDTPDELLFCWAVYFSGLVLLRYNENTKCKPNSLIFFINGAQFTSPKHLSNESLREQLCISYHLPSFSLSENSVEIPNEFDINSPTVSRSSSPISFQKEESLVTMSKTRFLQMICFAPDVKRSYKLVNLLLLQRLQRSSLYVKKESEDIVAEIKFLSLHCVTEEELSRKPRTSSMNYNHSHHSMGRTLSVLLSQQQQIDPKALYKGREMLKEIESLRCKKKLLEREYETMSKRLIHKRHNLEVLTKARVDLQIWLLKKNLQLKEETLQMPTYYEDYMEKLAKRKYLVECVERSRIALCLELVEIYPIGHNGKSHTVCGIPFPNLDAYLNNTKYMNNVGTEGVPPTALNAALGYIGHLVQMIAVIMNRPLRNPIIYDGSRTRVMDIIKDLPYATREYPLYTRSVIPSQPVRYAVFLLNQNIAQLCYDITGRRCDFRATIENILSIFSTLAQIHKSKRDLHHSTTITHPKYRLHLDDNKHYNGNLKNCSDDFLTKSHSSVDMNQEPPPPPSLSIHQMTSYLQMLPSSSSPVPILNSNNIHQRICRSVGSYSDSEETLSNVIDLGYSNSDSNLTFQTDD